MSNLNDLKNELISDPLARGYAGMTDAQAAVSLSTANRSKEYTTLSAAEIFEAIDVTEYTALTTQKRANVDLILGLGDGIKIGTGTKARGFLVDAFGAGTATRTALIALASRNVSRAEEQFGGELPAVYGFRTAVEAVTSARAL